MNIPKRILPWLLLLGSAALFYVPLDLRALWDSDEGRYAEIAREMLVLKDWVTPHLDYVLYFEKPPLVYWLTALSMKVFGINAFAARFWCAAFGVLTVLLTYRLGKAWKGQRVGLLGGAFLATSVGFFAMTQFLMLDMALTFWTTLAVFSGARLLGEQSQGKVRSWTYLLAVAMAGGILTKGVVALVLPLAAIASIVLYHRQWQLLKRVPWTTGLLLWGLLAVPWFVLVSIRNPIFPQFFFVHEHLMRYLTGVHQRSEPVWFFVPVLFVGCLPWSVFFPRVAHTWFGRHCAQLRLDSTGALLISWSAIVFIFFSLSHSKLVGYILPVFPALALLAAYELEKALNEYRAPAWLNRGMVALIVLFFLLCIAVGALHVPKVLSMVIRMSDPIVHPVLMHVAGRTGLMAVTLGIGAVVLMMARLMRRPLAYVGALILIQVLLLASLSAVAPLLNPYLSTRALAQRVQGHLKPTDKVVAYQVSYENSLQSLAFYLQRRIAVFGRYGELSLGEEHAADRASWFAPKETAKGVLLSMPPGTWGVTDERNWGTLVDYPDIFTPIDREGWLIVFRKEK